MTTLARVAKRKGSALLPLFLAAIANAAAAQSPAMREELYGDYVIEYPASRPALGAALRTALQNAPPLPALPPQAPTFGQPLRIIMADNDAHFNAITGGAIPDWGAGVADAQNGIIVLPGYGGGRGANNDVRRTLRHELAHVALHRFLAPARVPRWFNEGYATWAAGELDFSAEWRLRVAYALRKAPPLDSLELAWPRATEDARTAYLLSASIVAYLVRSSGERGLAIFLERWQTSHNMEQALAATYGISLDQLETHWVRDVRKRYGWLAVVTQAGAFMAGASVVMVALFAIRRRRDRKKLARLREDELPDAPAFWNEDEPVVSAEDPAIDESEKRPEV